MLAGFSIQVSAQSLENMVSIRTAVLITPNPDNIWRSIQPFPGTPFTTNATRNICTRGGVDVQLVLLQGTEVVNFDKFRLNTPQVVDTNSIDFSLIDQQRWSFQMHL